MEEVATWFQNWLAYSRDQIADSSFWWGALTTILGLIGIAALPAARGAITFLSSSVSRLFTGYYYYWRASYPDIISATQHILLRRPDGTIELCVDTIFSERALLAVMWNPYRAYLMRQTADFACHADPLIRLNPYGPKSRKWFRRPLTARKIGKLRKQIRHRYKNLYAPLVSAVAEHYTNPGAIRASRGETMVPLRIIIAKTYTGEQKHHRLHGIHEAAFLQWPQECPRIARPEYRARHELMLKLRDMYRRAPWRFDFVDEFVPLSQAPEGYERLLSQRKS